MDAATQNEEEYNELILIWLEEYNKQRDDLNRNVRAATERHILEVAIEMELKLNEQLPTNYRDVMNIVRTASSWTGEENQQKMRHFVYRVKYGEYKDRKIGWVTRCEQEWKARNKFVYTADPENSIHARTESIVIIATS